MFTPPKLNLNQEGLESILGKLESLILRLIWQYESVTIRELLGYLKNREKNYSFNTIMTVANRMVKKEILRKEKGLGQYRFSMVEDEILLKARINEFIHKYLEKFKL